MIKVKTNLLNETIASKEEKLKDIYATLAKLQKQAGKADKPEETIAEEENTNATPDVQAPETPSNEEPSSPSNE